MKYHKIRVEKIRAFSCKKGEIAMYNISGVATTSTDIRIEESKCWEIINLIKSTKLIG